MDPIEQAIAHFKLDIDSVNPVEESYSSIVRILRLRSGERLVLKIPFVRLKLHRELYALRELQAQLPVPEVLDVWVPDDDQPGALLLSLLPGRIITGIVSPRMAYKLGELLARLHENELPHFGDVFDAREQITDGWWQVLDQSFQKWLPFCEQVLPQAMIQRIRKEYDHLYSTLPPPDGPRYTHFDYRPANVMVEQEHITGLIDFESSRGGSADRDFIKIKIEVWDVNPETKAPFLAGYRSVRELPDIERTLPFYMLYNAFGAIGWCVRRSKLDDPFFDENLARLREILIF
jgi:Ser/Thr protein kinase RdoA (MazF antagonist)